MNKTVWNVPFGNRNLSGFWRLFLESRLFFLYPLQLFLARFAGDAVPGQGAHLQPLDVDLLPALLAQPVGAALDIYIYLWAIVMCVVGLVLIVVSWMRQRAAELRAEAEQPGVRS